MTQSKKDKDYYKMNEIFGVTRLRLVSGMEWGKLGMIRFLDNLAAEWGRDPYWQYEISENWADIPIGDISREGGGPLRSKQLRFNGHKSHRCGWDVDIYVIAKDGKPSEDTGYGQPNYDLERTKLLAELILKHGQNDIDKIFIGGRKLVDFMKEVASNLGVKNVILEDTSAEHLNHFHIRFKNKDRDLKCVN